MGFDVGFVVGRYRFRARRYKWTVSLKQRRRSGSALHSRIGLAPRPWPLQECRRAPDASNGRTVRSLLMSRIFMDLSLAHSSTMPALQQPMPVLLAQGAEARIYRVDDDLIVKHRLSKSYRHPALDAQLVKSRLLQEARCMAKCRLNGIDTPTLHSVDPTGRLTMEYIQGRTLRACLSDKAINTNMDLLRSWSNSIATALAKMHELDVVHGDLTTSNMMLRDSNHSLVLIDFGLAHVSGSLEDKAVDLYVLERAFISTHPDLPSMFEDILARYIQLSSKGAGFVKRYEEVRKRGRKREG